MKRQTDTYTSTEPEIIHNKEMKLDGITIASDTNGKTPEPLQAPPHIAEHTFAEDDIETDIEITGVVEVAQETKLPKNDVMDSTRASTRMVGNRFRMETETEPENEPTATAEEKKSANKKVKNDPVGKRFRPAWTKIVVENFNPMPKDGIYVRREDIRGFYIVSGLTLFFLTLFAMFPKRRKF